jgi:hypothetical protein
VSTSAEIAVCHNVQSTVQIVVLDIVLMAAAVVVTAVALALV